METKTLSLCFLWYVESRFFVPFFFQNLSQQRELKIWNTLQILFVQELRGNIRVIYKLRWQDFGFFWPPTPLRWHFLWCVCVRLFLQIFKIVRPQSVSTTSVHIRIRIKLELNWWYKLWQKVDIFGPPTYLVL